MENVNGIECSKMTMDSDCFPMYLHYMGGKTWSNGYISYMPGNWVRTNLNDVKGF